MGHDRGKLQIVIAWLTVACIGISIVLTLVASALTPDANMISSTISDVAAGPYDWVQDLAFYILAFALLALAYGMSQLSSSTWHWRIAISTMPIMAIAVVVMGFYQEYGDGDSNQKGVVIHTYLVYAFGLGFLTLVALSTPTLASRHSWWRPFNIVFFILWTALAVYYFNMSTGWDGLVERVLGLAYLGWLFTLAWRLAIEGGSAAAKKAAEATGPSSD